MFKIKNKKMNILIHVRSNEDLKNYIKMTENNNFDDNIKYSHEVKAMIEEFYNHNWGVYLTTIENFKNGIWHEIYSVNEQKQYDLNSNDMNEKIDFMIIRNLGSVEGNFKMISEYLDYIINNYKGIALNNPKAMKKGMIKNYLIDLNKDELERIGMHIIDTKIFDKSVSYQDILIEYQELDNYLIKPTTGELSNSLKCLKDIDENFLRYKEDKVGGWIIQPIKKEIWHGEYQMVFIGDELTYAQKKIYPINATSNIPNQSNRIIEKYNPTNKELEIGLNLIKYFTKLYKIDIDICRIDFMKDTNNEPILIEFEMVNPGFFIGYMQENDQSIKNIVQKIRNYCEEYQK